jgi:DNA-binding HxlR family transcriptional regulator
MKAAIERINHICPVDSGLKLIGGRWKARILWSLYTETKRFGELRRALGCITEKMLAQQLRELERDRLIIRTQYPEMPLRVEYSLSEFGRSLAPVLEALKAWGMENQSQILKIANSKAE